MNILKSAFLFLCAWNATPFFVGRHTGKKSDEKVAVWKEEEELTLCQCARGHGPLVGPSLYPEVGWAATSRLDPVASGCVLGVVIPKSPNTLEEKKWVGCVNWERQLVSGRAGDHSICVVRCDQQNPHYLTSQSSKTIILI